MVWGAVGGRWQVARRSSDKLDCSIEGLPALPTRASASIVRLWYSTVTAASGRESLPRRSRVPSRVAKGASPRRELSTRSASAPFCTLQPDSGPAAAARRVGPCSRASSRSAWRQRQQGQAEAAAARPLQPCARHVHPQLTSTVCGTCDGEAGAVRRELAHPRHGSSKRSCVVSPSPTASLPNSGPPDVL